MDKKYQQSRQRIKKMILRGIVIATVYMGIVLGMVIIFLAGIWLIKNILYSSIVLSVLCLAVGAGLFFCLTREQSMQLEPLAKPALYQVNEKAA